MINQRPNQETKQNKIYIVMANACMPIKQNVSLAITIEVFNFPKESLGSFSFGVLSPEYIKLVSQSKPLKI